MPISLRCLPSLGVNGIIEIQSTHLLAMPLLILDNNFEIIGLDHKRT